MTDKNHYRSIVAGQSVSIRLKGDALDKLYGVFMDGGSVDSAPNNMSKITITEDTDGWSIMTLDASLFAAGTDTISMTFAFAESGSIVLDLDYIRVN